MAAIDISSSGGGTLDTGILQLENGVAMSTTLTPVTDQSNTASQLKLASNLTQIAGTLQIKTDETNYIDIEDASGDNRFSISRLTTDQVVRIDFASNPVGSTTQVGAIRTYTNGVALADVMSFRRDGLLTLSNSIQFSNYNLTIATASIPLNAIYSASLQSVSAIADSGGAGIYFKDSGGSAYAKMGFGNLNTTIGQSTFGVVPDLSARLGVRGSGETAATTSLLVQNSAGSNAFQVTDDRVVRMIGATTLKISSPSGGVLPVVFSTIGATGGYRGGYDFKSGYNGLEGDTALRIVSPTTTTNFVGIGNLADGDISGGAAKLQIDNTISGGRNAAIKLRVNFADIVNQYNGIQFDTIETGAGGAFIGSQHNTPGSGYGSDLVILTTVDASGANAYTENARFIGRYNSFYVGADKTLAVASAKMQVESTTQGFLPPRMTNPQRAAITTPAIGLMVYCTDAVEGIYVYKSTGWTFVA